MPGKTNTMTFLVIVLWKENKTVKNEILKAKEQYLLTLLQFVKPHKERSRLKAGTKAYVNSKNSNPPL